MELTKQQLAGIEKGFVEIDLEKERVTYKNLRNGTKIYRLSDPEEQVRLEWFLDLVTKYQYEPKNIGLEVEMPKRVPNQLADLVIYEDGVENKYFVIEFKKANITDNEFEQAVKQGIGNGRVLKSKYFGTIAGETVRFFEEGKDDSLDDAFYSIPVKYGKPEEWTFTKGGVVDLEPVTMESLETALSKAHQSIWRGGKRNPAEAFGEVAKIIFIKVADEKKGRKIGEPYQFQRKRNESTHKLKARIDEIYEIERQKDKQVFQEEIKLNDKELAAVVEHLQRLNFNKTDLDIKGEAFQKFLGNFFKGEFGQYFTPNTVTRFCIDLFAPEMDNTSKVLDTSCGSGGFLLKALDVMREKASEYYENGTVEHFNYWHSFAENYLYGIEINESIARVAKMNMILHDDGHTNVISHDGLEPIENMTKLNLGFKENGFDYIFTNPPFGAVVKKTESDYLGSFELGKSGNKERPAQKTEILFIERFHQFLKPNGKISVVLPDGILTNSSLQYVREWILEHFKLLGVISLPQDAFRYYGAGVKSSVLVMEKWGTKKEKDYKIFMATVDKIGIDATGRKCDNELPQIAEQFREFLKNPANF
ncbi:MAG: N-6 DNA methylase [Candidatus Gracilibacteria bacterium]|nr:N-6 DNA methylase [Candidatus Gracilibacteria bacterium]